MKIVARIVMILLAALVVVAATSALINNGVIGAHGAGGREGERPASGEFDDDDGQSHGIGRSPAGQFGEHDGGRDGAVGSFLPGLLKNLTVIATIVAFVVLSQKIWSTFSRRRAKNHADGGDLPLVEKAPPGDI